jgi:hypothetical protein
VATRRGLEEAGVTDPIFASKVQWFLDRLDEPPRRIHSRGVWADPELGLGSTLGAPAIHREFALWLEAGERSTVTERQVVTCNHPGLSAADLGAGMTCQACARYDEAGAFAGMTGKREVVETRYRWPMRAALARVRHIPVKRGRPDLAVTLTQLAAADGDERRAVEALACRFPVVADAAVAHAHFALALNALRRQYRERPPVASVRPKSDAQLDAEAAA